MIGKLMDMGIEDVVEFHLSTALHPDIEIDGDLYMGTIHGEQTLLSIQERSMDNSDGAEWVRPYQTKTAVYLLLPESRSWSHYRDIE